MKFKMLVVCLLVGMAMVSFPKTYTYAAEDGTTITQEDVTNIENTDKSSAIDTSTVATGNTATDITQTAELTQTTETAEAAQEVTDAASADNEEVIEEVIEVEEDTEEDEEKTESTEVEKKKVTKTVKYTKSDLRLLSALIYCEANGESYQGKLAVGIVVMNRKRSGSFPDSVKGVVYQKYQFGPVLNGSLDNALAQYDNGNFTSDAEQECIKAAKAALSGTKSITVNGSKKNFSKYLFFSCSLRNATYQLGNHEFK